MYRIREWEQLPDYMKQEAVKPYYNDLRKKRGSMFIKRCFDVAMSFTMLLLLSPVFLFSVPQEVMVKSTNIAKTINIYFFTCLFMSMLLFNQCYM